MTRADLAARLARCEDSFRRAQRGGCPVRYAAALMALREAEAMAVQAINPQHVERRP